MADAEQSMTPEQYFFRYAFPCAEVLMQLKRVTPERFEELKTLAETGKTPSREILEDTYKLAMENLKKIFKSFDLPTVVGG